MKVLVEMLDQGVPAHAVATALAERMKEALGVRLEVEAVERGGLDHLTGLSSTSKIRRLIDRRRPISN
jgi:phenylacetate-coenzyme A ligase PaaK-like adenylate-forming protein